MDAKTVRNTLSHFQTGGRNSGKSLRLMLLGNREYLNELVEKYGTEITLGEVVKLEKEGITNHGK